METFMLPALAQRFQAIAVFVCFSVFQMVSSNCVSPPKPFATSYNGSTDTTYAVGTTLTYSCLTGFNSEAIYRTRVCLRDGSWTGRDSVCRLNFVDVFFALLATLGVVLFFIFLIACRLSQHRKRGFTDIKSQRSTTKKDLESTEAPNTTSNHQNTTNNHQNHYESPLPQGETTTEVSIESQSDGGHSNKGFAANGVSTPAAYETATDNEPDEDSNPELRTHTSPLYHTPSLLKQGTGWVHDDTSFDSLDLDTFKEKTETETPKSYF